MLSNSQCPDCKKILSDGRNRCACGWFGVAKSTSVSLYQCQCIEDGVRCEHMGTLSRKIKGNDWYCWKHADSEE